MISSLHHHFWVRGWKKLKIGQHLPKLWAIKYRVVFMKHGVYRIYLSGSSTFLRPNKREGETLSFPISFRWLNNLKIAFLEVFLWTSFSEWSIFVEIMHIMDSWWWKRETQWRWWRNLRFSVHCEVLHVSIISDVLILPVLLSTAYSSLNLHLSSVASEAICMRGHLQI